MVVMVYPYYLHYDLPTGSALSLSWFGNKLSIRYIMNLSSANYPYIWGRTAVTISLVYQRPRGSHHFRGIMEDQLEVQNHLAEPAQ